MPRVRARRGNVARYRLVDVVLGSEPVTADAWRSLGGELIRTYRSGLELLDAFWTYEPGIPDWLRTTPERGDVFALYAVGDAGDRRNYEAAEAAYDAVLTTRRHWLAENGYPTRTNRKETPR